MMNLMDALVVERDRLQAIKTALGDERYKPEFIFYVATLDHLIEQAAQAIGGHIDAVQSLMIYQHMKDFKE